MPARLLHFSEDPSIRRFEPRFLESSGCKDAVVWGIAPERAHLYCLPRDCPRVTFYATSRTSPADRVRLLGSAEKVVAIEEAWLSAVQATRLYRYEFAPEGFELFDANAGYWVSRQAVEPVALHPVGDLAEAQALAGAEFRVLPSLGPLYEDVIHSTLEFSIIRWRNAAPKPVS